MKVVGKPALIPELSTTKERKVLKYTVIEDVSSFELLPIRPYLHARKRLKKF